MYVCVWVWVCRHALHVLAGAVVLVPTMLVFLFHGRGGGGERRRHELSNYCIGFVIRGCMKACGYGGGVYGECFTSTVPGDYFSGQLDQLFTNLLMGTCSFTTSTAGLADWLLWARLKYT